MSKPGEILDYDANGGLVSIEILDASKHMLNPRSVEDAVVVEYEWDNRRPLVRSRKR